MSSLSDILARRTWLIPELSVWGTAGYGETDLLVVEKVGSTSAVFFGAVDIGGNEQDILFKSLIDHRGNRLPAQIESPCVIPKPKGPVTPFVVGRESTIGFRIAQSGSPKPVLTDLLVVELGN
jgi:hypothetical protein